jgi:hypothetical protein
VSALLSFVEYEVIFDSASVGPLLPQPASERMATLATHRNAMDRGERAAAGG